MSIHVPPSSEPAGKTEHRQLRTVLQRAEQAGDAREPPRPKS